jgi:hypothetical protein
MIRYISMSRILPDTTIPYHQTIVTAISAETVEKVQFLHFSKFAYNNIKHLEVYKLPLSGFSTVSLCIWNLKVLFMGCDIELLKK